MQKISIISLLVLSACAVGPDYTAPDSSLPSGWISSSKAADDKAAIDQEWWKHFKDPVLDQLIAKAEAGNFDLKIAEARIAEARAELAVARGGLLPTGDIKGTAERQANRIAFPGPINFTKPFNTFQTGFDASWELDLFGGQRRAIESADASAEATEARRDEARVSLLAEVARDYIAIRQYQAQLKIIHDTGAADEKSLSIAKERFNAGQAPGLDVTQAKSQLEQAQAQIPQKENMITQTELSLDVLLGEQPGAAKALVDKEAPIPEADAALVMAAPAAVIASRPDIRESERQLAAATAQQGVAVAKFFPDVSVTGFLGLLNLDSGRLLQGNSKSWDVGGGVLIPILNYGTLSANLDATNAKQQEAMATYQKTVIAALSDVERTLSTYEQQAKYRDELQKTVADDAHAADIADMRYKNGATSYLEVLDAKRTLYSSQTKLAEASAEHAQNLIAVYKSFGGGWQPSSAPSKTDKSVTN
jgi:NodT family efflux transporter outer membrane factor (OMF) lipoprotein